MHLLKDYDPEIHNALASELNRQIQTLELIASENFTSNAVMQACGSVLTNKYAEGYPGRRYYGGCEFADQVEDLAQKRVKRLFGATYANVQPHSGSQANMAVLFSTLKTGSKLLGFNLFHGGHLTHGSVVNFSGKLYNSYAYGVDPKTGRIDMNEVESISRKERPSLIICGGSAYSRDWDYKAFRTIADSIGALLMADIAHPAGLIATDLLSNPFPHCHIITSTTHKTLRGPRGGFILVQSDFENPKGITIKTKQGTRVKNMTEVLDAEVIPGIQGGPLMHIIAGKAVGFKENLHPEYKIYTQQVKKNASVMASEFIKRDYNIVSGGTDNHLMLIDLRSKHIHGKQAEVLLHKAGITVNKNMVPFDDKSPFITSGIRIGTPAITTRGMKETEASYIVSLIDKVISSSAESHIEVICQSVREEVTELASKFPIYNAELVD